MQFRLNKLEKSLVMCKIVLTH